MKSILSLVTSIFVAGLVFGSIFPAHMQWSTAWAFAPAFAGALVYNLCEQVLYAGEAYERFCSAGALFIFALTGWILGIYACAGYQQVEYLTNETIIIGGLSSLAALCIGVVFSWVTTTPVAEEPAPETATQPS